MSDSPNVVALVTAPDDEVAKTIARALVEEKLAACVNVLGGVTSVYRWDGEVNEDREVLLVVKARREQFPAISERVQALHPYDVPEVIALPITAGSAPYLAWLATT